jgi:hypothetical protein
MEEHLNNKMSITNEKNGYDMVNKAEKEMNIEIKLLYLIKACEYFLVSIKYSNQTEKYRLRSICDKYIKMGENIRIQLETEKNFFKK